MSTAFKRILVGVDDSADAKLAFKHAINQAIQGTIPCQVDTYKNENTIFLIQPNRGNIPPRFGHFF